MLAGAALLTAVFGTVYFLGKERGGRKFLAFKALATLMPAILAGFYGAEYGGASVWLTLAGILCYMAADVLLEIWLLTGVAVFGAGHICILASLLYENISWKVMAVCFSIFYSGMFLALKKYLRKLKGLLFPGMLYAVLLCAVAAGAVAGGICCRGISGILLGLGGVCFLASDTILGWNYLSGQQKRGLGAVLLILYYMAVYFFAARLYF